MFRETATTNKKGAFALFLFVTACLLGLIGLGIMLVGKIETQSTRGSATRSFNIRPLALVFLIFAGLFVLISAAYRQDTGEAVVIKSFSGKVLGQADTSAGLGWTAPWNKVIKYDIRNQKIEMFTVRNPNTGEVTKEGNDGAVIDAPLQGSSNAYMSITVGYDIVPDKVVDLHNQYKNEANLLDRALRPAVRNEAREATATFPPFQIKERRAELTRSILQRLSARWEPLGITVVSVDIGSLTLDPKTEEALQKVNQNQADVESARHALDKSRVDAERTKTDAAAQADADQITRCGATRTTETREVAGKPEQVTVIVPKTGAECENLLNEQVLLRGLIDVYGKLAEGNQLVITTGDTLLQLPAVGGK